MSAVVFTFSAAAPGIVAGESLTAAAAGGSGPPGTTGRAPRGVASGVPRGVEEEALPIERKREPPVAEAADDVCCAVAARPCGLDARLRDVRVATDCVAPAPKRRAVAAPDAEADADAVEDEAAMRFLRASASSAA